MSLFRLLALVLLLSTFAACTSSGVGRLQAPNQTKSVPKVVTTRASDSQRINDYMPEVVAELRAAGFTVMPNQKAPYEVEITFPGVGFDINCSIVLYENGVPVVSGRSVNLGFGTWLVRGAAYRQVFTAALRQFSARLRR